MPRNEQGVYFLPAGNPVVTGTTIRSDWANPTMDDIANALTGSLPRSGSAPMTGPLILAGDAVNDLAAVPKQQVNTLFDLKFETDYRPEFEQYQQNCATSEANTASSAQDSANCRQETYNLTQETLGYRNETETFRDETLVYRNDTQAIYDDIQGDGSFTRQTSGTGAIITPTGTTLQRPTPVTGHFRFNSETGEWEGYDGTEWGALGGGGGIVPPEATQTVNFTAEVGKAYPVDCSSGDITVTEPVTPEVGDWFILMDSGFTWGQGTGKCYLSGTCYGQSDCSMNEANASYVWQYFGAVEGWRIVDGIGEEASRGGDITTIWTGSAGNGVTVDWSGTSYVLSQFDAILLSMSSTNRHADNIALPSSLLLTSGGDIYEVLTARSTGGEMVRTYVSSATETSLLFASQASTWTVMNLTGIYGINYK
jgi:hypothetical protein